MLSRPAVHPLSIPHAQHSVIVPAEIWKSGANDRLIDLGLAAVMHARTVSHADIASKMREYPHWPEIWPGEHYKLLTGIVAVLKPQLVIEIGTATGYSALAIKKALAATSKVVTYDIVPWQVFPNCILTESDFRDGRLTQILGDLSDPEFFEQEGHTLRKAELIFIDAAKDGIQERKFIEHFSNLEFESRPIFMFDDIRLMNMIEIWQNLNKSKLDLTSFGHWSGTGLVDWHATSSVI